MSWCRHRPPTALGAGACTISGTIRFTPTVAGTNRGTWAIAPAVIQCRGLFNVFWGGPIGGGYLGPGEHMVGPGRSFTASGTYTPISSAAGGCLPELGHGQVDYWIGTIRQTVHMLEEGAFHLVGAGAFSTPTLRGTFQIPLLERNCLTGAAASALFLAEVTLVRTGSLG